MPQGELLIEGRRLIKNVCTSNQRQALGAALSDSIPILLTAKLPVPDDMPASQMALLAQC